MSENRKWIIRIIAVVAVLISVGMEMGFVTIPAIGAYRFWIITISFVLLFFTSLK